LERSIIRPGDGFIELQSNCVSGVAGGRRLWTGHPPRPGWCRTGRPGV